MAILGLGCGTLSAIIGFCAIYCLQLSDETLAALHVSHDADEVRWALKIALFISTFLLLCSAALLGIGR